jgi:hypothetical protein
VGRRDCHSPRPWSAAGGSRGRGKTAGSYHAGFEQLALYPMARQCLLRRQDAPPSPPVRRLDGRPCSVASPRGCLPFPLAWTLPSFEGRRRARPMVSKRCGDRCWMDDQFAPHLDSHPTPPVALRSSRRPQAMHWLRSSALPMGRLAHVRECGSPQTGSRQCQAVPRNLVLWKLPTLGRYASHARRGDGGHWRYQALEAGAHYSNRRGKGRARPHRGTFGGQLPSGDAVRSCAAV